MDFKQLLKGLVAAALAILIASNTTSGIYTENSEAFAVAVLLLGIFNIFLKPLLMLFSLPFIVLTFGLGIWVINALLFLLVASIVSGFHVESFLSALWGAFIFSVINLIATIYLGDLKSRQFRVRVNRSGHVSGVDRGFHRSAIPRQPKTSLKDDDVIDV